MTIPVQALEQVGTCVLAVDDAGIIRCVSERLSALLGTNLTGRQLDRFAVEVDRPIVALGLRQSGETVLPLRGAWIALDDERMQVFVGSPAPETADEMNRLGIGVDDFLENDSWLNYLIRSDECVATQTDAVERISLMKQERAKLTETRDQMRDARRATLNMMQDIEHARQKAEQARTELEAAHRELVEMSRRAGMAEVASGVLHNVGNVLNSVNVSASVVADKLRKSRVSGLTKAVKLMRDHADDLGNFVSEHEKGRQLPGYLGKLAEHLVNEQASALGELESLCKNIDHIKDIVSMQQSYTGVSGTIEPVALGSLLDDALRMNASSFERHGVRVVREYQKTPPVPVDKHKLLQILVNLVGNAKHALLQRDAGDAQLTPRIELTGDDRVRIEVSDNGVGIAKENLTRVFAHGFTTKKDGHGFGLHSAALAAKEMGGSLSVHSDGPGKGATFTLEFPFEPAEVTV